jgi:hypothetical protein
VKDFITLLLQATAEKARRSWAARWHKGQMSISQLHASHIREVNVGFIISVPKVDPLQLSDLTKIQSDRSAKKGDERRNARGDLLGYEDNGWWRIESSFRLEVTGVGKKDINEHLHALLNTLFPHAELLNQVSECGETFFDVLWKSSYLYAGTGPLIEARHLSGIAELNAGMGFIYIRLTKRTKMLTLLLQATAQEPRRC